MQSENFKKYLIVHSNLERSNFNYNLISKWKNEPTLSGKREEPLDEKAVTFKIINIIFKFYSIWTTGADSKICCT